MNIGRRGGGVRPVYPASLRISDKTKILPLLRLCLSHESEDSGSCRSPAIDHESMLGQMFDSTGVHTSDYKDYINAITDGIPAIQFPNTRTSSAAGGG